MELIKSRLSSRDEAALFQLFKGAGGLEQGNVLDVVQAVQLPRQLHHGKGRAQGGHLRPHQGLIGDGPAIAGRENRLEMVAHRLIPQHLLKLVAGLHGVGLLIVHADVKLFHLALAGMLDLIHGKISVLFQGIEIRAVLRVPGHAARDADVQLAAAGQDGSAVLQGRAQLFQLFPHGVPAVVTVEQQHELIAREAGREGARRGYWAARQRPVWRRYWSPQSWP